MAGGVEHAITRADVLKHELKRLEGSVHRFLTRRAEEEPYVMIIRRDDLGGSASSQQIIVLAKHLKTLELMEAGSGPIDQGYIDYYAQTLGCAPADVTRERIVDFEKRVIAEEKRRLQNFLTDERFLGEPFDYKKRQAQDLRERAASEKARCDTIVEATDTAHPAPAETPA